MSWEARALEAEAGLVVAQARIADLEARLANLADRDPLTGLHNRAAFEDQVAMLAATSERYGPEGALVMVRIAGLDEVRAVAGVDVADALLEAAADRCQAVLRTTDIVARWGIDELAVLVPRATDGHAAAVATKLVDAVAAASTPKVPRGAVKAHAGAANADRTGNADDLVVRATTRMLAAVRRDVPVNAEVSAHH